MDHHPGHAILENAHWNLQRPIGYYSAFLGRKARRGKNELPSGPQLPPPEVKSRKFKRHVSTFSDAVRCVFGRQMREAQTGCWGWRCIVSGWVVLIVCIMRIRCRPESNFAHSSPPAIQCLSQDSAGQLSECFPVEEYENREARHRIHSSQISTVSTSSSIMRRMILQGCDSSPVATSKVASSLT